MGEIDGFPNADKALKDFQDGAIQTANSLGLKQMDFLAGVNFGVGAALGILESAGVSEREIGVDFLKLLFEKVKR